MISLQACPAAANPSIEDRVPKQTPSINDRQICPRVWPNESETKAPFANGSQTGVRDPWKVVRDTNPSDPGGILEASLSNDL